MRLRTAGATLLMTALLSGLPPSRMAAQARAAGQTVPVKQAEVVIDPQSAQETRERLRELLNEFPPALAEVLRLDPSLLSNDDYLAPYPRLAAFLHQHPDVSRNPSFFLGDVRLGGSEVNSRHQTINALEEIGVGIGVFLFFMTALGVVTHIGRGVLEHRRWLHAMKVQTEANNKIVERLGSNEELMAYVQSPAGQRYLSTTALAADAESRTLGAGFGALSASAPVGRILGSAQIGVVTVFGGIGLWIAKNHVIDELAQPLSVLSVLGIALGLGFVLSAAVAYAMSRQLGLIRVPSSHA
jgi:hypothetical protein